MNVVKLMAIHPALHLSGSEAAVSFQARDPARPDPTRKDVGGVRAANSIRPALVARANQVVADLVPSYLDLAYPKCIWPAPKSPIKPITIR